MKGRTIRLEKVVNLQLGAADLRSESPRPFRLMLMMVMLPLLLLGSDRKWPLQPVEASLHEAQELLGHLGLLVHQPHAKG